MSVGNVPRCESWRPQLRYHQVINHQDPAIKEPFKRDSIQGIYINSSIGLEFIINLKVFRFYKKNPRQQKCFFLQRKNQICGKKTVDLEEQAVETTLTATPGSKRRGWSDRHQLRERYIVFPQYLQGFMHPTGGWEWDFWTINSMIKDISHES